MMSKKKFMDNIQKNVNEFRQSTIKDIAEEILDRITNSFVNDGNYEEYVELRKEYGLEE